MPQLKRVKQGDDLPFSSQLTMTEKTSSKTKQHKLLVSNRCHSEKELIVPLQSAAEVKSTEDHEKQTCERHLPSFLGIDNIIFIDLDNWQSHLLPLLSYFPDTALFWCFHGGKNILKEPLK